MTKTEPDNLTNFFAGLAKSVWFVAYHTFRGCFNKTTWTPESITIFVVYAVAMTTIIFAPRWNLPVILYLATPFPIIKWISKMIFLHVARAWQLLSIPISIGTWCFIVGLIEFRQKNKINQAIGHLGLKTSMGLEPKVIGVTPIDENKTKISVLAVGIGIGEFSAKKGALESSLNKIVQEISVSPSSRQVYEIITSNKALPTKYRFDSVSDRLSKPYTFLVGQADRGFVTGDLCELHHMLIAGSTGGGKSVFFKQILVGLLKSSQHIHLYLIDLKRGVEFRFFESLPNVYVARNVVDAIACLKILEAEMNRRFEILERTGFTEIDPGRDRLDRLVIGIDEASILFTVEKGSKSNKDLANEARELTDKLTKLGRSAGIHVILATQKVTKETIDTRVQTNIHAKICFRVNTIASSMTVLGNKKAAELPEIQGRGIWSVGSTDTEVQVPYLGHEEAKEEVAHLSPKFSENGAATFQKLIVEETIKQKKAVKFSKRANNKSEESE